MNKTLNTFLEEGLQYTYQAEQKILEGLRWLEEKATSSSLKDALRKHQKETTKQIERLKKACEMLNIECEKPEESTLKKAIEKGKEIAMDLTNWGSSLKVSALQALLDETRNAIDRFKNADSKLLDIFFCGACEQIELAEISTYNFLCYVSRKLDEPEILKLLQENLAEEKKTLEMLTKISDTELLELKGPESNQEEEEEEIFARARIGKINK